ncbi:hypothetical protein CHGG_05437 [Chaetomium globosum CBS 148.51]|uniref:GPI inositol-deacylase n=1 Tax=Chaetomium globosum (strain ATCC 6205 / CBS 148.51 / DSM 1962 / NBRC 6347 / NRRL 1970) TaxID=306901 RepID=Q2H7C8_CHAGB|nr:uncharacterized protein CHGG_05437 [Chaetomium globosum CBS 148.51]EAQ88818.1 hypothetical protein CHGG_05437 [Chaetomium globosum CBS 148.51]
MNLRKAHLDSPWPPNDRKVGVILVAHSMGGFVATDCLFRILDEHRQTPPPDGAAAPTPIFPLIQGILAFDTPLNGLARSMFVYGAFSNYQKVSHVFNIMTALSAATPAALSRLASKRALRSATNRIAKSTTATRTTTSPAWKAWQLIALRTGTVGVIAAGGVAAFAHRRQILEGVRSVRALTRADIVQGYQQSVGAVGQGLAYVNRGNVGQSFAWLADHFTFVGALLKQNELTRRLERLAGLRGVGVCDVYASLGENGYWSGGYFVLERTFCAVPGRGEPEGRLFVRHVVEGAKDEIAAHVGLFRKGDNGDDDEVPDESPIDIAAAASLVPLPDEIDEQLSGDTGDAGGDGKVDQKRAYLRHLFGVAQQTGTSLRSYLPSKLPTVEMPKVSIPAVNLPSMPAMPSVPSMPAMPSMLMPTRINPFSKAPATETTATETTTSVGSAEAAEAAEAAPTATAKVGADDGKSGGEEAGAARSVSLSGKRAFASGLWQLPSGGDSAMWK